MPLRHSSLRFRRTWLFLVLLALALAQTLGLMHRIVHGPLPAPLAHVVVADEAQASPDWLHSLFAGHDQKHDCRLYDQISHADLACGQLPALEPIEFVESPVVVHSAWHLAWQAAGFLARGPPTLS